MLLNTYNSIQYQSFFQQTEVVQSIPMNHQQFNLISVFVYTQLKDQT